MGSSRNATTSAISATRAIAGFRNLGFRPLSEELFQRFEKENEAAHQSEEGSEEETGASTEDEVHGTGTALRVGSKLVRRRGRRRPTVPATSAGPRIHLRELRAEEDDVRRPVDP